MRLPMSALVLAGPILLVGCAARLPSQSPQAKWSTGFWFWNGSNAETTALSGPVDVLFVHVGDISGPERPPGFVQRLSGEPRWNAYGYLPDELPAAREYWLVWRYGRQGVPDLAAVPAIAREFARLALDAQGHRLKVTGLQLDIDSPTVALPKYSQFLVEVRKYLPKGSQISITALLDWFRPGTAIEDVIREVEEFVPQFYDVQDPNDYDKGTAIAARVDADRWGSRFRRFGKPFRIGISTFGRARIVPRTDNARAGGYVDMELFRDVTPLDVATNSNFEMRASRNPAGELVLTYRAARPAKIGYSSFEPGDTVQFILAAPESVRAAVESARRMGDGVAGVVFFRWPTPEEELTMQPDEVLRAAGLAPPDSAAHSRVDVVDGRCAEVACVDLYLQTAAPLAPKAIRYFIRSSTDLEYFVPERNVPARMTGVSRLEVSVPPYCGRARCILAVRCH
jgi:hypothetical protein